MSPEVSPLPPLPALPPRRAGVRRVTTLSQAVYFYVPVPAAAGGLRGKLETTGSPRPLFTRHGRGQQKGSQRLPGRPPAPLSSRVSGLGSGCLATGATYSDCPAWQIANSRGSQSPGVTPGVTPGVGVLSEWQEPQLSGQKPGHRISTLLSIIIFLS